MKIAVTSTNWKTVSGHGGLCPNFLLFELNRDHTIRCKNITLKTSQILEHLKTGICAEPDHPLCGIDALIAESVGEELSVKLSDQGIKVMRTKEKEPLNAINGLELTLK